MSAKVYFTREITPAKVLELYNLLGCELEGNVAVKVHEITFGKRLARMTLDKRRIIPIRHEANILTVPLMSIDKAFFLRDTADFLLAVVPQGKERMRQLMLR